MSGPLSLYQVKPRGASLVTEAAADFDEVAYSRFKHGDGSVAERYGRELAALLLSTGRELVQHGEPLVIASAPYKYVPTASYELALQMRRAVSAMLAPRGHALQPEIGTIRMARVDSTNYATLDTESRRKALVRANLYIDGADFADRHVLFVDDARITGLAETAVTELVTAAGARSVTCAYVVQIVENCGPFCPDVENRINHAFVRDLTSLLELLRSGRFVLNIRTVKYVLGWSDHDELDAFFGQLAHAELSAIHDAAARTGPAFTRCYREPLRLLRKALGRDGARKGGPRIGRAAHWPGSSRDSATGSVDA